MKKVISISTDRNIFKEGSAVRARQVEYGALFDELHIVIFTKLTSFLPTKIQIAPNVWVYGTHSVSKLLYVHDAVNIARKIISRKNFTARNSVVSVQDPFETGLVGAKLAKKTGLPLHVQIHTDFLSPYFSKESFLNRLRVKMARKLLPLADAIRVVSQRIADSMLLDQNIHLKQGVLPVVLPIFTDVKNAADAQPAVQSAPESVPATDLKKKYPQFNFIILMASRLTPEKNISFALRVFAKLLTVYPKIGLVVVGSGPEEKALKSLVKKLGTVAGLNGTGLKVANSVVFEPWQNDLSHYYKSANLFLLTSNYEGYGLTLVEAVAAHCPVVSTDVGIASQLLKTEKPEDGACSVCPVGDMACCFDSISKFIENPALREKCVFEAQNNLSKIVISSRQEYVEKYRENIESAKGL